MTFPAAKSTYLRLLYFTIKNSWLCVRVFLYITRTKTKLLLCVCACMLREESNFEFIASSHLKCVLSFPRGKLNQNLEYEYDSVRKFMNPPIP